MVHSGMTSLLEKLLLVIFLFVVIFLSVIYLDPTHHFAKNRDLKRQQDLQEIMDVLSATARDPLTGQKGVPLPNHLEQIGGTAQDCQLETSNCHITDSSCYNLNRLMPSDTTSPSDPQYGTITKTEYAIVKTATSSATGAAAREVTLIACHPEISQKIELTGTLPTPAPTIIPTATSSAKYVQK